MLNPNKFIGVAAFVFISLQSGNALSQDDHGGTTETATVLMLDIPETGRLESEDDVDFFRLEITEPTRLSIYTTGLLDTVGSLLDDEGYEIGQDDDDGASMNFRIFMRLDPGLYYVSVRSFSDALGLYTLSADRDHGDTTETATVIMLGMPAIGWIEPGDDVDFFRLEITEPTRLSIYTTGSLDTVGSLLDDEGDQIDENDDGDFNEFIQFFTNRNFKILTRELVPGVYYVKVESHLSSEGPYTLHVDYPSKDDTASGAMDGGILLLLLLVCLAGAARSLSLTPHSPRPRLRD